MSPNSVSYGETGKDLDLWSLGCCVLGRDLGGIRTMKRDKIVKAYICMRGDERTQPSPVTVSDNIKAKIALQLENFVRRNFSKTQSIRVPAAAQLMPNKTIIA
uniref:Uncharacterized protein n=1 Tax=Brassica oleracea var. oleracea TaxID=109376 RepID=A0A0D3CXE9_BRAOL